METTANKCVVVIGAGASGLTSIKACKEEGIDVVCYEITDNIGGLWRFREKDIDGVASVMKSTVINSSKEISAFSDFPPPKSFPNYMHNSMMLRYLELYAEKFNLVPHITFEHRVLWVKPSQDYDETGRWTVRVKNLVTNAIKEETYDAVMAGTGHQVYPLRPKFPGEEKFRGSIIHTHSYKTPKRYEDKRVLVVGVGNSGGDVAVELSNISSKVYLSTRRGCWILHRVGPDGMPFEAKYLCRMWNFLYHVTPYPISCYLAEREINKKFNHELYQLKPNHRIFGQHPMVNDSLPNKILSGTVVVKGDINRFVENGVIFEGEDKVTELDAVVLATGYDMKFPFIPEEVVSVNNCRVKVYKFVFPPQLKHPTFGLIGMIQIVGGIFPICEIQARWFVQVLIGNASLPPVEEMYRDIKKTQDIMNNRYFSGHRHTIQVDYVDYLDDISSKIGAKPNFCAMFFKDPQLFWACYTGPCLSYHYRLQGPHSWLAARHTILSYEKRVAAALKTRHKFSNKESALANHSIIPPIGKLRNFFRDL